MAALGALLSAAPASPAGAPRPAFQTATAAATAAAAGGGRRRQRPGTATASSSSSSLSSVLSAFKHPSSVPKRRRHQWTHGLAAAAGVRAGGVVEAKEAVREAEEQKGMEIAVPALVVEAEEAAAAAPGLQATPWDWLAARWQEVLRQHLHHPPVAAQLAHVGDDDKDSGLPAASAMPATVEHEEPPAKQEDMHTLKRLMREAYGELVLVRSRMDRLEQRTGLRPRPDLGPAASEVSAAAAAGMPSLDASAAGMPYGQTRTRLMGHVRTTAGYISVDPGQVEDAQRALRESEFDTGGRLRVRFESAVREEDALIAECEADASGIGTFRLSKLMYRAQLAEGRAQAAVSAVGARGADLVENLDAVTGDGLTARYGAGAELLRACDGGAGAGIEWRSDRTAVNAAVFLSSQAEGLSQAALAQAVLRLNESNAVSLMVAQRAWSSSSTLREAAPLLFSSLKHGGQAPALHNGSTSREGASTSNEAEEQLPQPRSYVGISTALKFNEVCTFTGWASLSQRSARPHWAVTLAPAGLGDGWCVRAEGGPPPAAVSKEAHALQLEAFRRYTLGNGFVLQPGLLHIRRPGFHSTAVVFNSHWSF
eukprot:jgi/Chlat1/6988/Chrsp56S06677